MEQSATLGVVQCEMVIWTTLDEACSPVNYCTGSAALSHTLCLDMNRKKRNPLVVNTRVCASSTSFSLHSHLTVLGSQTTTLEICERICRDGSFNKKCSGNETNNGNTSDLLVTLLTLHWREEKYQKDENIRYLWAETLAVYLNTLISVMAVVVAVFCKMVNG